MDIGLIVGGLLVFAIGYLLGREHAGGGRRDDRPRRRMRAHNDVAGRQASRYRAPAKPAAAVSSAASPRRRGGIGGFMDAINMEAMAGAMPAASQNLIREGDRAGAARSLVAAYPSISLEVARDAVDTWAARNGL